jgi:MFS family permease
MVLDTAVMNVSISQLVEDFDTTVTTIQMAITLYALVMAALMITGGKLGDRWGRKRAFGIGMAIYATGSAITAVSWSVGALMVGWSVIEGIGSALVLPALLALVAENFAGKDRAMAYGVLGGIAGAGVAVGPIVGGWVTTYLTWRVVFGAEVVVAIFILLALRWVGGAERSENPPELDIGGSVLSASGLALVVLGIVQSSSWGLVIPKNSPIELLGFSLSLYCIIGGFGLLYAFARWERHREAAGKDVLVNLDLLKVTPLRAGLVTALSTQLVLMGVFFANPLYLQVVQGYNAFETGLRMLPVSVMLFISAVGGAKVAGKYSPRSLVRTGFLTIFVAIVGLLALIEPNISTVPYMFFLGVLGTGIGLITSQIGNVTQSAVNEDARSEVGGLQNTAAQFGSAVGTALIGAIVLVGLSASIGKLVAEDPAISAPVKEQVAAATEKGIPFVSSADMAATISDAGVTGAEAESLNTTYETAQLNALKVGLLVAGLVTLGALSLTNGLPTQPLAKLEEEPEPEPEPQTESTD